MYNNSLYGNFRTRTFAEIWDRAENFLNDYKQSGLYSANNNISDSATNALFYLLYSEYGGSHIGSSDENQFKYQVFSTIYEYGPTWEKRIEIQNKLRSLSDDELAQGTKSIYNKALNPGNTPTTEELNYINEQTTSNVKRGKLDKYTELYSILDTDVTKDFIGKFKRFFNPIALPELPLWYVTNNEEEEEQ